MRQKGKHFLPKKSTPRAKMTGAPIPPAPTSLTMPDRRDPATNLALPSEESVREAREFCEENQK